MSRLSAYRQQAVQQLTGLYEAQEAASIVRIWLEERLGERPLSPVRELMAEEKRMLESDLQKMMTGEPLQYVLGKTWFDRLTLAVDNRVLIPRPETEELVHWIVEEHPGFSGNILDIGTGSGAIALALKDRLPDALVFACDTSDEILDLAAENSNNSKLQLVLLQADVLQSEAWNAFPSVQVIVSNPPYIPLYELAEMHVNVGEHEPHQALFVPDDDPLLFYRTILTEGCKKLLPGGFFYFEIHEQMEQQLISLLTELGLLHFQFRKDMQEKVRMLRVHNV